MKQQRKNKHLLPAILTVLAVCLEFCRQILYRLQTGSLIRHRRCISGRTPRTGI